MTVRPLADLLSAPLPETVPCTCCGADAHRVGAVDFNKNCEELHGRQVLAAAGLPVTYHRCGACGLMFTRSFDAFGHPEFAAHIYNDGYEAVDPEYRELRPAHNARWIAAAFGATPWLRILDYGAGSGALAGRLRDAGFATVVAYDPFVHGHDARPAGVFDLVLCFEVLEHAPDPLATMRDIASFTDAEGLIVCSTLLRYADADADPLAWWYTAPRNGHVSLYTERTLALLARAFGLTFGTFDGVLHAMYRRVPGWAEHFLGH